MAVKALILNCTLKKSPKESNTEALIKKAVAHYQELGVEAEVVRIIDHNILTGISSDEGQGDEWPMINAKVKTANIIVIATPIWFGVRGSVCQMVMERLSGGYDEADPDTGQYPLYNKVGACIVTGNEDGAHDVCSNTLFNLTHLGATIAPNSDSYWVGEAGPGPSYIEIGQKNLYTNRTISYLTHNTAYMAELLANNPIPTNLKDLDEIAKNVSDSPAKKHVRI
ncbi:MAG: flavodoxin family protein [Patescibacteria group bacterium]|nr:flavodoxin family protein [Patescibacteria group bacterium]